MNLLPQNISRVGLTCHWFYKNEKGDPIALVVRYDLDNGKKRYQQYQLNAQGEWEEGSATPLPLFGIETVHGCHANQSVYIFEGEKCAQAAHNLNLPAVTTMRGAQQAHLADWSILAQCRHIKRFVVVPDNDEPGRAYAEVVCKEVKRACPFSEISIIELPLHNKGDDFVDWIKEQDSFLRDLWDGFGTIQEEYGINIALKFEAYVERNFISADTFFLRETVAKPIFEGDPEPLASKLTDVLPCPIETFPEPIREWIHGFAEQMQIPCDYLTASLLVYVGGLIGRKRGLRMRSGTDWIEYPNLWGLLVGRPSAMKSPAMQSMRGPFQVIADRANKDYEESIKSYELELAAYNIRKKGYEEVYKSKCKKSIEKGLLVYDQKFQCEEMPQKPKRKRYKTEDPTVEKLGEMFAENPQGMLLFRDEISGWLYSFEKTGRENDRQFFLESWSGKEDFDVDRISRGSLHVSALCLSIFGSIQPGPLSQYIRSAMKGGIGDDGLIQRFQVMVWPDVKADWDLVQGMLTPEQEARVQDLFDFIDKLQFDTDENPVFLYFTEEAQALFDIWQERHEKLLRKGDLPPHIESHLAKYKKLLPALCLILEHIHAAVRTEYPQEISYQTLEKAMTWLKYFESHACRIYGSGVNAIPKTAVELINRLQKGEIKEPFSVRDVYYSHHWSGLSNAAEVEEVVQFLVEKNYLKNAPVKTVGRTTIKYWVHPKVFEK